MHWQASRAWRILDWRHRYVPVLITVALGVGFTFSVCAAVQWWESTNIEKDFRLAAEDRASAVKATFEIELAMIELVRSALMSDGRIERQEFRSMLMPFSLHGKTVRAIEWVPRVPHAQRETFEAAARRDGLPDFRITELDPKGSLIAAAERSEYFPIFYVGPDSGDKSVYGFDLSSEPMRRESLHLARDTGKTVVSGRVSFVENARRLNGFLVYFPTYQKGHTPQTVKERRQRLHGFVLGVFQPQEMLLSASARLQPEGIDVCLVDESVADGETPFYFQASRTRTEPTARLNLKELRDRSQLTYTTPLEVAGHRWTILCTPTPYFFAMRRNGWSDGILIVGFAITGILAMYLARGIERRAYVEGLLAEKRRYASELEVKVQEQTSDVRRAQEEVIYRLVSASQWRDEETGMHIRRTGLLSEALARAAGWSASEAEIIRQAAPMHDVGKIGIPDAILQKPGKLTPTEFAIMKTHTLIGAKMLAKSNVPILQMAREIALNHHERWDGSGYPYGKAGDEIPECARILTIVDVYDALIHNRVYRDAMNENKVLKILRAGAGTHFDPLLITQFFLVLDEVRRITIEHPDEPFREQQLPLLSAAEAEALLEQLVDPLELPVVTE